MKLTVLKFETNSKWIALVVAQVKIRMYDFSEPAELLIKRGPAKSIPEVSKGGVSIILSLGSGAIISLPAEALYLLHTKQVFNTDFTHLLPLMMKYFSRRWA